MIRFAIDGDLRFISHHDMIRVFERALARAALPVRFSEGFNPRPKLSFPLPRAVGIASDDETVIVDCSEPIEPDVAQERLLPQMPQGLVLLDTRLLSDGERCNPSQTSYSVPVPPDMRDRVRDRVLHIMSQDRLEIERTHHKTGVSRTLDIRQYLIDMVAHSDRVEWNQSICDSGTVRPAEILQAIELPPEDNLHRIRRLSVRFD